ncbi:MAG: FHA domain-containing protein [Planctomycetes bacterium]|nr:FHA domain-containing protein [Planctomycetota bacterium]
MPVRLVSASSGKTVKLDKPVVLIGRNPDCDVVLTKSRKVSRAHCLVACVNNQIVVRDLGSTNGVWVNGQRVERESRVRLGDELSVADVRYHLVNIDQSESNGKAKKKSKSKKTSKARDIVPANQPVALPDEDDSFVVEATSPRLPRVTPDQVAAAEARDDDSSCDVIPLDEEAMQRLNSPNPLEVPDTGPEIDQAGFPIASSPSDGEFRMQEEDEDESEEAFSILDSVDESDDIVPLASIDDDDDESDEEA